MDWQHTYYMLASALLSLALFYVGMQLAAFFSELLIVIVVGGLVAFLLYEVSFPLARLMPWWVAVSLTYLAFLALLGAAIALLIPAMVDQIAQLVQSLPHYAERLQAIVQNWQVFLQKRHVTLDLPYYLARATEHLQAALTSVSAALPGFLLASFSTLLNGVFAFILSVYLLIDYHLLWDRATRLFSPRFRPLLHYVRAESYTALHKFVIGSGLGSLFLLITNMVAFYACGFQYALFASVTYAVIVIIPYFGAIFAHILLLVLSALQGNWMVFLVVNLSAFVFLNVRDYVLSPYLFSESMGLHPIAVLLVLLVGARIAGVLGMILSIPVSGVLFAILRAIWWEEEPGPAALQTIAGIPSFEGPLPPGERAVGASAVGELASRTDDDSNDEGLAPLATPPSGESAAG